MRKIYILIFLSAFYLNGFAQSDDIETLKKLNRDWINSYTTKDTATMARIFADDLVLVNPSGKIFYKKNILNNVMSPDQQFSSSKVDTVSVRILGNIGLVSAKATITAKVDNQNTSIQTSYLDVYEKRNGRWYAIASQVALVSEK